MVFFLLNFRTTTWGQSSTMKLFNIRYIKKYYDYKVFDRYLNNFTLRYLKT